MSRACLHDTLDTLVFHALSWLSGYFQGKFQGLAVVGCNVTNALGPVCVHSGQFLCVLPRRDTVGLFLLWMLTTLANHTDVGGALSFLENRVRIQNVDQVEKSPGKNEKQFRKG